MLNGFGAVGVVRTNQLLIVGATGLFERLQFKGLGVVDRDFEGLVVPPRTFSTTVIAVFGACLSGVGKNQSGGCCIRQRLPQGGEGGRSPVGGRG